ncbi:hypothetical protein BC939DRAFT_445362 [Gamsiella multidivaricata]|uniref:uncharacterized protein n=1 Tax=Gamsiella multidivaricata TaxID=101098 RepID=UPI00221ECA54|nr:uncharacterized protein BC939DRAFT_445362 [Gamsiella multidivaricata]KAI7827474.1 hypothetical protein BC939DRAFT_445362 [Gamsiella multidivaricata]
MGSRGKWNHEFVLQLPIVFGKNWLVIIHLLSVDFVRRLSDQRLKASQGSFLFIPAELRSFFGMMNSSVPKASPDHQRTLRLSGAYGGQLQLYLFPHRRQQAKEQIGKQSCQSSVSEDVPTISFSIFTPIRFIFAHATPLRAYISTTHTHIHKYTHIHKHTHMFSEGVATADHVHVRAPWAMTRPRHVS